MAAVFLKDSPFIDIVISAIEVYKKECFGVLLGSRKGKDFVVRHAASFQSANRHYDFININALRERRVHGSLSFMLSHKIIGDFHSHADFPENLSRFDRKEMQKSPGHVFILAVVRNSNRLYDWASNADRSISGSIGKKFFVKMMAFTVHKNKILRINIECPYMERLNRMISLYEEIANGVMPFSVHSMKNRMKKMML